VNILKNLQLPGDSSCLIALSGGGDSVALLDMTSRLAPELGISLSAAKVMHGIRSESEEDAEAEFCNELCRERGVPFSILTGDGDTVADIQLKYGCGPEHAARYFRQTLLRKHMSDIAAQYILFGHTADDQLETVFMRLLSGSGPEGLAGISFESGSSIRPLLGISRSDLRSYLVSENISWMEDSTNNENRYRRNRMRNELIPLVQDIYPGWSKALETLGERSREADVSLKAAVSSQLVCRKTENECIWKECDWDATTDYLKALSLWDAFNYLDNSGIPDRKLSWKSVKEARRSVDKNQIWNSFGLKLERTGGSVIMSRPPEAGMSTVRILLDREDVGADFSAVLGGYRVEASFRKVTGLRSILMNDGDWPLELRFGSRIKYPVPGKRCVTEKKAVNKSTDSRGKLVYIFIEPVKEGIHAGK